MIFYFLIYTNNFFKWKNDFYGQDFTIEYVNFIENAKEGLVESIDGEDYLKIVEASDGSRHDHFLEIRTSNQCSQYFICTK